jgi:HK97 family phage prohead protease
MSTDTETAQAAEDTARTDTDVRRPLIREFAAELTPGDGRTVEVRVVPYGIPAIVSDGGPAYQEEWAAGCFDDQLRAANRVDVLLNFEHLQGPGGLIGKGTELRSEPDGLHATFRMLKGQDGDKTLELVNDGILGGVSLEAYAKKSVRTAEGVVRRVKAHLRNVALCRNPAFADARVLAVREEPEFVIDEDLLPVSIDPELVERCRKLGIALPESLKAHPGETGTPAPAGTPEDGTRPDGDPSS